MVLVKNDERQNKKILTKILYCWIKLIGQKKFNDKKNNLKETFLQQKKGYDKTLGIKYN